MFPSLSAVMAAYDEAENLRPVVAEVLAFLREQVADPELIIVDDGSTDGTGPIADDLARVEPGVIAVHHDRNRGIGAALKTGFARATKQWVTILPADGQIAPWEIALFFDDALDADLVTSVYRARHDGGYRKVLSWGLRAATRLVAGADVRSEGIYVVRRDVLAELPLESDSFFLNLELPLRAARAGKRVRTVTMTARPRRAGRSKSSALRHVAIVFGELVRYRRSLRRR